MIWITLFQSPNQTKKSKEPNRNQLKKTEKKAKPNEWIGFGLQFFCLFVHFRAELPCFLFNYYTFHSRFPTLQKFQGFGLNEEEEAQISQMNMDGPLDFENEDPLVNPPPSAEKRSNPFFSYLLIPIDNSLDFACQF